MDGRAERTELNFIMLCLPFQFRWNDFSLLIALREQSSIPDHSTAQAGRDLPALPALPA